MAALRLKKLEVCVPLVRGRRGAPGVPLFPGVVFCRFEHVKRIRVLNTPGVISINVGADGPAAIDDEEMLALRRVVDAGGSIEQCPFQRCGERVEVTRGTLKGLRGFLQRSNGDSRVVLSLTAIVRSFSILVDPGNLGLRELHATVAQRLPLDFQIAG